MRRQQQAPFSLFAFQDIITATTGVILLVTIVLALWFISSRPQAAVNSQTPLNELRTEVERLANQRATLEARLGESETLTETLSDLTDQSVRLELNISHQEIDTLEAEVKALHRKKEEVSAQFRQRYSRLSEEVTVKAEELDHVKSEAAELADQLASIRNSNRLIYRPPDGFTKKPWLVELSGRGIGFAPASDAGEVKRYRSPAEFLASAGSLSPTSHFFVIFIQPSGIKWYPGLLEKLRNKGFDCGVDIIGEDSTIVGML